MHDAVKRMLSKYECDTEDKAINALREILQEITLLGLWRSKFFEHAAFYGGTALRILYGLDRYSEDLDFSLIKRDLRFNLDPYFAAIERELQSFGFDVRVEKRQKREENPIQSAFVKTDTVQSLLEISVEKGIVDSVQPGRLLKIKLEIDTDPPQGFNMEAKYLLKPVAFAVKTYTLPDLFAGKLHAILCRKWKNRVKGRDWYDLVWYLANYPRLHLAHLEQRMRQSGHWEKDFTLDKEVLLKLLGATIADLNVAQAQRDVKPFIKDPGDISIWSREFFMAILEKIIIVDGKPGTENRENRGQTTFLE